MESSLNTGEKRTTQTKTPHPREASSRAPVNARRTRESRVAQGPSSTDALLARAKAGDGEAFGALLAEVRPRAMAVALKVLRNPDDAEDAVQDAFLKIWRYLARFEGRSSFSTWLHRIVMNSALDMVRRQSTRTESLVEEDEDGPRAADEPSHDETPERRLGQAETNALVHGALESLSVVHRQAITLRELEERSYEEIARAAACPIGTVMSRLHHARRRLADELRGTLADAPELCAA